MGDRTGFSLGLDSIAKSKPTASGRRRGILRSHWVPGDLSPVGMDDVSGEWNR